MAEFIPPPPVPDEEEAAFTPPPPIPDEEPAPFLSGSMSGSEDLRFEKPTVETPTLTKTDPRYPAVATDVAAGKLVLDQTLLPTRVDAFTLLDQTQRSGQVAVAEVKARLARERLDKIGADPFHPDYYQAREEEQVLSDRAKVMNERYQADTPFGKMSAESAAASQREAQRRADFEASGEGPGVVGTFLEKLGSMAMNVAGGVAETFAPSIGTAPARALMEQGAEMGEMANVNQSTGGKVARGAATVAGLLAGNPAGAIPATMAVGLKGAMDAFSQTLQQTGDSALADQAAMHTFPVLALYMATGIAGARAAAGMTPVNAAPAAKALSGLVGAGITNIGTTAVISAVEGRSYGIEELTADTLLAFSHSHREYARGVSEQGRKRAEAELLSRGFSEEQINRPFEFGENTPAFRVLVQPEVRPPVETSTGAPPRLFEVLPGAPSAAAPKTETVVNHDPDGLGAKEWIAQKVKTGVSREEAAQLWSDGIQSAIDAVKDLPIGSIAKNRQGQRYVKTSDGWHELLESGDYSDSSVTLDSAFRGGEIESVGSGRIEKPGAAKKTSPLSPHKPQSDRPHIVSTAISTPKGLLHGPEWNTSHKDDSLTKRAVNENILDDDFISGITKDREGIRGFIIQNADGSQTFRGREGTLQTAIDAGQLPEGSTKINSQELKPPGTYKVKPPTASRPDIQKAVDSPMFKIELPEVAPPAETPATPGLAPLRRTDRSTVGAIGGGGGTPQVRPIGGPPSGSKTWLKIQPWWKRGGAEREGASAILQTRQQNPIGKALGKATDKQFDVEAELQGRMWKSVADATQGLSTKQQKAAFDELAKYTREKENNRLPPPLSSTAQKLLEGWKDIAEFTGLLAQRSGVKVAGDKGYRPIFLIGREYVPRMFDPAFLRAVRDPNKFAAEFNGYVNDLAAKWGVAPDVAAKELNDMAGGKGRLASNDFMGNIEVARGEKLPESFYDYDMRRVMAKYIDGYSRRMAQIIAYGQRLEGPKGPVQKNLWDMALDEVQGGDKTTAQWIEEAEAQSIGERQLGAAWRIAARLQTVATGMLLGNPTSTVPRNLFSGLETATELMGMRRTLKAATQAIMKPAARLEPREAGVIKDDMAALLHAEQLTGDNALDNSLRWLTNTVLKASGYSVSENFVRTTNFLAGSAFARDFAALAAKSPNSRKARQMAGLIERMGVKPDDVIGEKGDWRGGEATRTFIRKLVNSSQGGYRFNQVPLWAGTPAGRFFYQFGRWGTQRAQNLWKNVLSPALIGTESTINGAKVSVRDFKPLVRMAIGTVALGEGFALLAQGLFGKDRRDASLTEITTAWGEDKKKALQLAGGRLVNDIIMSGSLGIWGQPVDWGMAAKDQSRLKNPAEPPGGTFIRSAIGLVQNLIDQGTLTQDDIKRFGQSFAPGVPAVTDVIRNAFDQPKYEAENDQRTLRMAGIRFAKDSGMDVEQGGGKDEPRKNERTPVFASIRDALIVGDTARAKELEAKYLASMDATKHEQAKRSLRASVVGRQPFRVGPYTSEEVKTNFYQWAQKNLSKQDLEQVRRVQARYENTAIAAEMWKN